MRVFLRDADFQRYLRACIRQFETITYAFRAYVFFILSNTLGAQVTYVDLVPSLYKSHPLAAALEIFDTSVAAVCI